MRKLRKPVLTTLVFAVVGLVGLGIYAVVTSDDAINDGYALVGAADMVIDYMDAHHGAWPRTWDDLRPQFEKHNGRVAGWSFEQFQTRVAIDFAADPQQLRQASRESPVAAFEVIQPRHAGAVQMGAGPNQMLCDYFRRTATNAPR
ncbi:MAG: hypothetical protein QM775_33110 [Pirellulales bacterium]